MGFPKSSIVTMYLFLVMVMVRGEPEIAPPGTHASPGVQLQACVENGMYALTFDDGPTELTMTVVEKLNRLGVVGTFFVLGERIEQYPEVFKTTYGAGHLVASHSYSHPKFTDLTVPQMREELDKTSDLFKQLIGVRPRYFRAPSGFVNDEVINLIKEYQYNLIFWNLDTLDWQGYDGTTILKSIETQLDSATPTTKSFIDVKHDRVPATTVYVLEDIVTLIQSKGYKIVSLPDCVGDALPSPYSP
ncbi:hypothetical protein R1flu_015769 [Riccia fluitans]|uniref:NodB homology domain-containing protein n=1 Tax=Riccia fluitans TaxID=41844 RepID=A0ABD1YJW4_9MARC